MAEELTRGGLERFAAGDVAGATRLWLDALEKAPDDPQIRAYLEHVRALVPDVVASVEAERQATRPTELSRAEALGALLPPPPPPIVSSAPDVPIPEPGVIAAPVAPMRVPEEDTVPMFHPERVRALAFDPEPRPAALPTPIEPAFVTPAPIFAPAAETVAPAVAPPAPTPFAAPAPEVAPPPLGDASSTTAVAADETWQVATAVSPPQGVDPWAGSDSEKAVHVISSGPGLALFETPAAPPPAAEEPAVDLATMRKRLRELRELDDFSGALEAANAILSAVPDDAEALAAVLACRDSLTRMYESKLGDTRAVPLVRLPPGEVIWLDLDHRAGFVLAQVDGVSSYEEIVEVTGMERLESLRILAQLVQNGVIAP